MVGVFHCNLFFAGGDDRCWRCLDDHPRTCKWLESPQVISHNKAIWKGCPHPEQFHGTRHAVQIRHPYLQWLFFSNWKCGKPGRNIQYRNKERNEGESFRLETTASRGPTHLSGWPQDGGPAGDRTPSIAGCASWHLAGHLWWHSQLRAPTCWPNLGFHVVAICWQRALVVNGHIEANQNDPALYKSLEPSWLDS